MARQARSLRIVRGSLEPPQEEGPRVMRASLRIGCRADRRLLLLAVLECGAEDVAERGAGVGRAVLGHRLLLLGDLESLDRERDLAGLAIDLGHAGIDLVALGEALGALVVAVAAEVGAADESRHF